MMTTWKERVKAYLLRQAHSRYAGAVLATIAFVESSFFPLPPDLFLIPAVVLRPEKWWRWATITSVFSVLGGLFGYVIGFWLYELLAVPLIDFYQLADEVAKVEVFLHNNAFWGMLISAFTPIPYKVFTITAGAFRVSIPIFIVASVIGRSARFFLEAYLMQRYGAQTGRVIFSKLNRYSLLVVVAVIVLVGLVIWAR